MSIVVTWLGHATVVVDIDGVRLVADPLLRRHNGPLRRKWPSPSREVWAGARAVLLSHLHHDHAEVSSLRLLGDVPVFTAVENAVWVEGKGLRGHGLREEWVQVDEASDVFVRLVPAVHRSRPMPHRPNAANGHLVKGPSGVVWVAGDTELYHEMEALAADGGSSDRRRRRTGGRLGATTLPGASGAPRGSSRLSDGRRETGSAGALGNPARPRWAQLPTRVDGCRRTCLRDSRRRRGARVPGRGAQAGRLGAGVVGGRAAPAVGAAVRSSSGSSG